MGILSELTTHDADELAANCTPAMRAALDRYASGAHDNAPGMFQSFINPVH
ncbi:hypothetical protein [Nocardia acidivorans]|uniref:hypothetical protein n=1 Tax=Nocardia acidivorans TaxID=404580 RepID=UPI000A62C7AE|nr:hypothetical protein [Nocardia acidivorans]